MYGLKIFSIYLMFIYVFQIRLHFISSAASSQLSLLDFSDSNFFTLKLFAKKQINQCLIRCFFANILSVKNRVCIALKTVLQSSNIYLCFFKLYITANLISFLINMSVNIDFIHATYVSIIQSLLWLSIRSIRS